MIKVVIDCFGGDEAPLEIVKGAVDALNDNDNLFMVLVGDEDKIKSLLTEFNYTGNNYSIVDAKEIIENNESPTSAIRTKRDSSLVRAFDELRTLDDIAGFVGAGSTGAVLTAAFMKLGRIKGVSRPALCPILPTVKGGQVAIIDCGANMDTKPINLVHFALMGNAYLKSVFGIENPRIALLNVGVEEHKGNELSKQVFDCLKSIKGINFVGNMEARELLSGEYDLVVTDGFAGNVLLKSTEGAILSLLKMLKKEIKSSKLSMFGSLFMKKSFRNLKKNIDYNNKGGAVLLGCKKIVVKSHGSSKALSIKASIEQVMDMYNAKVVDKIEDAISNTKVDFLEENSTQN